MHLSFLTSRQEPRELDAKFLAFAYDLVFASSFSEGDSAAADKCRDSQHSQESLQNRRRGIIMVEDFENVNNILYYLYTSRITFSASNVSPEELSSESSALQVCDAEGIYALHIDWKLKSSNLRPCDYQIDL